MAKKVIAFLVFPDLTLLDLVGPLQFLKTLEAHGEFEVVTVGERAELMTSDTGLKVLPERAFSEVTSPFALIVPGGVLGPFEAMANDALMAYLRAAAETATVVGSVCTGSLVLAAAGLLNGLRATTHWAFLGQLSALGAVPVQERWVEDGKFITSAGVAAGMDMALALIRRLTDEATARVTQLVLEYSPQPPFGDIDRAKIDEALMARQMSGLGAERIPEILAGKPELRAKLAL